MTVCLIQVRTGIFLFEGGLDLNFQFTMGARTDVYGSCSAILNGEFYIFGGHQGFQRQVLLIRAIRFLKSMNRSWQLFNKF